ncbi:carboxypeptidase regulatory-like domain-containing protein [Ekhidna sp. To15]|uniref:carboxypeptidase regulatory-like domain-containing protein n=1 Tax=Ekhidna sp. To15 TaxID=3395267 RepID=UPI003F523137
MRNFRIEAIICCLLLILPCLTALSQELLNTANSSGFTISGVVKDANTGAPLPYCNVYFSGSLKGVYTNEDGSFTLKDVEAGQYELVISFVGYTTQTKTLQIDDNLENLSIRLVENKKKLEDLEVVIKRDREWENQLKRFERDLLGEIPMSRYCEISNPWVVTFTGDKNQFIATAEEPLEIVNKALGFHMVMNLDKFIRNGDIFDYKGYFHFEILKPANEKQESKWIQNRKDAYLGSVAHFLRSLVESNTVDAGFSVRSVGRENQAENIYKKSQVSLKELVNISRKGDLWRLELKEPILLEYQYEYTHGAPQLSLLTKTPNEEILFNSYGILNDPSKLKIGGYLAEEGVTTLLPKEYLIDGEMLIKKKADQALRASFINSFTSYSDKEPLKTFLRTDKETYYSGETIWMRGYLVNAINNKPVYDQDVIHVELLDSNKNILKKHRLKSINSGANGSFILSDSISTGDYFLKAYTNSLDQVFVRKIQIFSFEDENLSADSKAKKEDTTLLFFPESGELIDGIKTQVAFQSNANNITGTIFSEKDKKITSFSSTVSGMGTFIIKADSKQKYYALIDGVDNKFWLPDAIDEGVSIRLENEAQIKFEVTVSEIYGDTDLYILIHNSGRLFFFENLNTTRDQEYTFDKEQLSTGINHITIFDSKKRPLAERLFYIPSEDNADSLIAIETEKTVYSKREKVNLALSLGYKYPDSVYTDLSISVLDLDQSDHSVDIASYFKIFADTDIPIPTSKAPIFLKNFRTAPDLFMQIYGWRRFDWNEFFYPKPLENLTDDVSISGSVTTKNGSPFDNTDLILLNKDNGELYNSKTDAFGNFQFAKLGITDTTNLILKAMDAGGKIANPIFKIDSSYQESKALPFVRDELATNQKSVTPETLQIAFERNQVTDLGKYTLLNEVVVSVQREEKIDPRKSALGKGNYSLKTSEIGGRETFGHVYDIVRGRVPSLTFVRASRGMDPNAVYVILRGYTNPGASYESQAALILVDNVPMTPDGLGAVNPGDIESVEVYTGAAASVYGARGQNGVIAYFTKRGSPNYSTNSDPLTTSFIYKNGYYAYKEFRHPDYSRLSPTDSFKDLRSTVYWNPNVTLVNAKENLSFYTTDRQTELLIDVQGVNQFGELIHETKVIEVRN